MKEARIVFFGTPVFACSILQTLIDDAYNVVGVVSQPDKPQGRKKKLVPTPVKQLAMANGIEVIQPEKLRASVDEVLALKPDLIITCAYGQFVPTSILEAPKYGCLNIHPSLLPKYRGGAPVHHAIWNGDHETGVCLMEMVKAMDAGDVFARCITPIDDDETTETLNLKLEKDACKLLHDNLPLYFEGKLERQVQDESKVVIARNISREEERVNFHEKNLHEIYNHIRALIDWPIAYGIVDDTRLKFYRVRIEEKEMNVEPGTILGFNDDAMEIACIGGILKVYDLQLAGKKRMDANAFANGAGRNMIQHVFE